MINCTLIAAIGMATSINSLDLASGDLEHAQIVAAIAMGREHAAMIAGNPALAARERSGSILCQGGEWIVWGPSASGIVSADVETAPLEEAN